MPRRPLLAALVLLAAAPAAADARVVVIAGSDGAVLTDTATDDVVARVPVGGRARGAAVTPDGTRAFVGAGSRVVAIDLAARATDGSARRPGGVLDLTMAGGQVVVARRRGVDVLDAATLDVVREIDLGRTAAPRAVAAAPDGSRAVVVLDRRRVAVVDLLRGTVRRVALRGATGAAFSPTAPGVAYVLARTGRGSRLVRLDTATRRTRAIRLGRGLGGGVAISPTGATALAGAAPGERVTAVVDLRRGRLAKRIRTGRGPGHPAFSPDLIRAYVAERGTVSVLSTLRRARIRIQRLGSTRSTGAVVQPGQALKTGTDGPDVLGGTRLDDRLLGLGGDDTLRGRRGRDVLEGGDGHDHLVGGTLDDQLDGGAGTDRLFGQSGNDTLLGAGDPDALFGGTGNDKLDGGDAGDYLDGGDGDDVVEGGEGDDRLIEQGLGNDFLLSGGPGDDLIDGNRGSDEIEGGPGNDTLLGRSGSERIDGGDGDDTIDGGTAGDRLFGRDGDDVVRGDIGRDTIYGARGNDALDGGSGDDYLSGSYGADLIVAGPGRDRVNGGMGHDEIRVADADADVVDCGRGRDTVYVEEDAPGRDSLRNCERVVAVPAEPANDAPSSVSNIFGTAGDDTLFGTAGDDSLFGGDGADDLYGNEGSDYVDGENGPDVLHGGPGDDELHGRNHDDVVLGNEGNDTMTGDRGRDTLNGGPGDDNLNGNLDDDVLEGAEGDDRIQAVAGGRDRISCGPGFDTVFADVHDAVDADCEDVRR